MEEPKPVNRALIGIIVAVVLAGITSGVTYLNKSTANATATMSTTTNNTIGASSPVTSSGNLTYKNGTYQASSTYRTPDGRESIGVSITLANNAITDVTINQNPQQRDSQFYQSQFADNYRSDVIGKNVSEVNLSRVAGSSLTSGGFNDALAMIKQNAQA